MQDRVVAEPNGIQGWLLVFLMLGVVAALRFVPGIWEIFHTADKAPEFKNGLYVLGGLNVLWLLFFCYCLYGIVSIRKNAIKLIKIYLLISILLSIIEPFIALLVIPLGSGAWLLSGAGIAKYYNEIYDIELVLGFIIVSCIWYRYFSVSVRVKNTWSIYDTPPLPVAEPNGIRGWLLVFIILGVLGILLSLSDIPGAFSIADESPGLKNGVYALVILNVVWQLFFCYCLHGIVSISKNAIKLIKFFLLANLFAEFLLPIVTLLFLSLSNGLWVLNGENLMERYFDSIGYLLGAITSFCIWYRYFSVSVRVKNTWSIHDIPPPPVAGDEESAPSPAQ